MTKESPLAFPFFFFPLAAPEGSGVALKSRLRRYSSRAIAAVPQALLRLAACFFAADFLAVFFGAFAAVLAGALLEVRAGALLGGLRGPASRLCFGRAMRSTTFAPAASDLGTGAVEPSSSRDS